MDPYVVIQYGSETKKTQVHEKGGLSPKWNQTFTFDNTKSDTVHFAVWDKDTFFDDLIGKGTLKITDLKKSPNSLQKE